MKSPSEDVRSAYLAVLLGCWASVAIGPLSFFVIPALAVAASVAIYHKSWPALCLLSLLNPLFVVCGFAVTSYLGGAPTLAFIGLPELESFNIDRSSRCFRSGGGCVTCGNEWLFNSTHNATLQTMSNLFGPPAKSYDGPYPTKEEADHLSADVPPSSIQEFLQGDVQVDDETISLGKENVARLVERFFYAIKFRPGAEETYLVKAVLFERRCLVLRISEAAESAFNGTANEFLILFDTSNKRPFAYFTLLGYSRSRTPPLHYLANWDR